MANPRVTICVLLYGDYPENAQQTLGSIVEHCDRELYELRVGMNVCSQATIDYVLSLSEVDQLIISRQNINKSPMMRRLFKDVQTEFTWWFDDDTFVIDPKALLARIKIAEACSPDVAMWGKAAYMDELEKYSFGYDIGGWIEKQAWYRGYEPPSGMYRRDPEALSATPKRWYFCVGSNWFIRSSLIPLIDDCIKTLIKSRDDVIISEAIRQYGYEFGNIDYIGIDVTRAPTRGEGEDADTMAQQLDL